MPWTTPTLATVRQRTRDYIVSKLQLPLVPNSVTRFVADALGGLAHLCLQYIDWLSLQLLPDTAETEWLDRHANLWLKNADGTKGRKAPTSASGTVSMTGTAGSPVPVGTELQQTNGIFGAVLYQTTEYSVIGDGPTPVPVTAIDAGVRGNMVLGDSLTFLTSVANVDGVATVVSMSGGSDQETDDELRIRVLERIQKPPMGGDSDDYVEWALSFPGVTRAWCSPKEMGIGTVTVRFMMDDLRANNGGFPTLDDVQAVQSWIDHRRPVTALDTFVVAPVRDPVSFTLTHLESHDETTLQNIRASVEDMFRQKAAPAFAINGITQPAATIYAVWVSEAVMKAAGVTSFDIMMDDHAPTSNGHLAVLGNITLG